MGMLDVHVLSHEWMGVFSLCCICACCVFCFVCSSVLATLSPRVFQLIQRTTTMPLAKYVILCHLVNEFLLRICIFLSIFLSLSFPPSLPPSFLLSPSPSFSFLISCPFCLVSSFPWSLSHSLSPLSCSLSPLPPSLFSSFISHALCLFQNITLLNYTGFNFHTFANNLLVSCHTTCYDKVDDNQCYL